jgi:AbrB family looped-hinge helix DNA binding protein
MTEALSTLTRKGQVTVPVAIRRALGLKRGDKVAFTLEAGTVRLVRSPSVAERTAGALKSDLPALSPREEREAFEQGVAAEVLEELGGR